MTELVLQRPAGEILPESSLVQIFIPNEDFLSSITVILANFKRRPKCKLRTDIYILDSGENWHSILEIEEDGRSIYDNEPHCIFLPPNKILAGSKLKICISSPDATSGAALTAWLHAGDKRIPGHVSCALGNENFSNHGLLAELGYCSPLASTEIPQGILLSPVTQCNLNCTHCISRVTRKTLNRLSPTIRSEIQNWCSTGKLKGIATDYSGDLLWADAHFGGELDYLIGLDVPFDIDTNGVHLNGSVVNKLLKTKLRNINVSLDAARAQTYKKIRRGAPPLSEILTNVRDFSIALTASGLRKRIRFSIGFTLMESNIGELPEFVVMAAGLGVPAIFCRHLEVYTEDMQLESLYHNQARFNEMRLESLLSADYFGIHLSIPPPFDDAHEGNGRMPCLEPWRSAVILGNGDVAACCVPGTKIGNLNESPMQVLWQSENYQNFRRRVNSSDPPNSCRSCPIHRTRNNRLGYFPYLAAADSVKVG